MMRSRRSGMAADRDANVALLSTAVVAKCTGGPLLGCPDVWRQATACWFT
jgi:hypothetical protein